MSRFLTDIAGGWSLHQTDGLPEGVLGATRWEDRTIWIGHDLTADELAHTVLHELMHVVLGPGGDHDAVEGAADRGAIAVMDLLGLDSRKPREAGAFPEWLALRR